MNIDRYRKLLQGQTAIITGASSGVGRATALAFAAERVRVVLTARRKDRLVELQREIISMGGSAAISIGDAAEESTVMATIEMALEQFGRIDILVNNAGQGLYKNLVDTTLQDYDELLNSNLRSSFLFTRHVVPHLINQRYGSIIFVSSVAGLIGKATETIYAATKFAQVGFAQSLGEELRGYGIKVTCLCPGGIKTEFAIGRGRTTEQVAKSRMMDASAVADTIVFACMQPENVRLTQLSVRHMGEPSY